MYQNHLEYLLEQNLGPSLQSFWFSGSEVRPQICISNKSPDDVDVVWGPYFKNHWIRVQLGQNCGPPSPPTHDTGFI